MATGNLYPDFIALLKSLNSAGVKYLLVGGYAVAVHGYERTTQDIDVWIAVEPTNAERISLALQDFGGFSPASVKPEMFLEVGRIFMFGRQPVRIDLLTGPSGVEFDDCYARRMLVEMCGVEVPVISLPDLRANKHASGRPKDLIDLEHLPPSGSPAENDPSRRPT